MLEHNEQIEQHEEVILEDELDIKEDPVLEKMFKQKSEIVAPSISDLNQTFI